MSKPLLMVYIFTCHVKNQWNLRYGSIRRAGDYSVFLFSKGNLVAKRKCLLHKYCTYFELCIIAEY